MTGKHWLVIAGLLGAIGLQVSSAKAWVDLLTPMCVGGLVMQIAATLGALFAEPPAK